MAAVHAPNDVTDNYEALVEFLYRAPIGLAEITAEGTIEMLNPMGAQLLMPLAPNADLGNLFAVLDQVAPQLRQIARDYDHPSGVVCESVRIDLGSVAARGDIDVLAISLLKLEDGRLMAVLADATLAVSREQQKLSRRLSDAARTDTLTQMPNRAAVREQLQRIIDKVPAEGSTDSAGCAVLFLNCDRFKQINDALGHATGDEVLGLMAERLRATLRPGDRISTPPGLQPMAARIGSDEFVVILDGMRRMDDLLGVARRVLDVLSAPYATQLHLVSCSVSMGLVLTGQTSIEADVVLQDASIAMVEAKQAGGSRFAVFDAAMRERAANRSDMETELRRALSEDELFVIYQPVVGLQINGSIDRSAGVEALVRWQHPLKGVVQPLEFIGIAEDCGLIGALGDFVLEAACRDFMHWQVAMGDRAPRSLAVNLSRAQLAQPGWLPRVREILLTTGMPPQCLQLEITESLAAQDEKVQQRLHDLKALGLKLALDDFGTGYSSLACLHLLPVDTVKIDRSFVCQADQSLHHKVLVDATVRVAHSLGMNTVAEGIETPAQLDVVQELGCDKGQGYLFSRPLTSAALMKWLMDP
jgi:diguanylate cyclase (GGDEF)-like protein